MDDNHRTVLLTGGFGLIGNALKLQLEHHFSVTTLGRHPDNTVVADLNQYRGLPRIQNSHVVIHAAGITNEETNADAEAALLRASFGTKALLEQTCSTATELLIYISSAHVYGELAGKIDESRCPDPRSLYAQCHYMTEQVFKDFATQHRIPVLILRPCAVYTLPPDLNLVKRWALIPYAFPQSAVNGQNITLSTSGDQIRNFVDAKHLASLIIDAINAPEKSAITVINSIGTDNLSVRAFAKLCAHRYELVSGEHCAITAPSPRGELAPPLLYQSLYPQHPSKNSLSDFLDQLTRRLLQDEH